MKKRKSMFFERITQNRGKDWLQCVSPEELNKFALSFFKDLAHGSIDKTLWGQAFYNGQFMTVMVNRAQSEAIQNNFVRMGLDSLAVTNPGINNDNMYQVAYTHYMRRGLALDFILQGLQNIAYTGNLGMLDWISNNAKQYKYDL